ncbi:MAG: DEAD/DEAH box helicase [Planctomycetota bacterium]
MAREVEPPRTVTSSDAAALRRELVPAGEEARARVAALLKSRKSGIPSDLLTDLMMALHGEAGFVILRAAAQATERRMQITASEKLRVRERPANGAFGDYRTARPRQAPRPYTTRLYRLVPLEASCDCPDFRGNSLGLCKHVLAVLADLSKRKRVLARARAHPLPSRTEPELRWSVCKPLTGCGDWMMQIELHWPQGGSKPAAPWRELRRAFAPGAGGHPMRLRTAHAGDVRRRSELVCRLRSCTDDPALCGWIADEQERLTTAAALASLSRPPARPRGFRRELYPFQRDGVARFLATGRLLLADDMGLGKTTQAIAACHILHHHGSVRRGLLVVPAPLKQQWLREWQACSDLPIEVVDGGPDERAACYRRTKRGFLVVNYEQVLRDVEIAQEWNADLVLLDEAQRIKNWQTKTAATIKQLEVPFRLVLTGTPFENRLSELDSILEWLDRRPLQPMWRLLPHHQMADGQGMQNLDVLRERLAPVLVRRRRQEVLSQLPERTDTCIDVPLTAVQQEEHDERTQPIVQILSRAERRPLTRAEFLRLMMLFTEQRILANGMAQFEFEEVWPAIEKAQPTRALLDSLAMPKLAELRALLHELVVEQERKVVVFSAWRRALRLADWAVAAPLQQHGVQSKFFTGAESQRRRDENIVAFHDDPATRILFATDAGGVGLNLQRAASCCVHFDLPWNPAVFEQRVGRVWRLGQTEKVDVYSLVGECSIETRMAGALRTKQAAFSAVFDGDSDEVRFEERGGFLRAARKLVDDVGVGAAADTEEDDADKDARLATGRGREAADRSVGEPPPGGAGVDEGVDAPEVASQRAGLELAGVRSLLAGLSVQPRSDGGLVIEADRESAAVLAEVLRGLAGVLEGAAADSGR